MPELYAIRVTGGKREYYWSKKDYQNGVSRSQDAARKRRERAAARIKKAIAASHGVR